MDVGRRRREKEEEGYWGKQVREGKGGGRAEPVWRTEE